jgi:plasmid stability protein
MAAMTREPASRTEIRPFHIRNLEEKVVDLLRLIAATRRPSTELVADRSEGVQLEAPQALARYRGTEYDFGRVEARLNALPQFMTEIDGVDVHFHPRQVVARHPASAVIYFSAIDKGGDFAT